jgi:hypothetical protein
MTRLSTRGLGLAGFIAFAPAALSSIGGAAALQTLRGEP